MAHVLAAVLGLVLIIAFTSGQGSQNKTKTLKHLFDNLFLDPFKCYNCLPQGNDPDDMCKGKSNIMDAVNAKKATADACSANYCCYCSGTYNGKTGKKYYFFIYADKVQSLNVFKISLCTVKPLTLS